MANPLPPLIDKHLGTDFVPRMKVYLLGFVADFWKDGTENPFAFVQQLKHGDFHHHLNAAAQTQTSPTPHAHWHAVPGELAEKMWGAGYVLPGGDALCEQLIQPLGLAKDMTVLDLSAGLGGLMRKIVATGATVTGLEADATIAARGMQLSLATRTAQTTPIAPYDPATFSATGLYDRIVARELFYLIADKPAFFKAISASAKPKAQIAFTDYIVDPEHKTQTAITAWQGAEKKAAPIGLVEMAEIWSKAGFTLSVHDDMSALYKKEIVVGLKRLALFLGTAAYPDKETKHALLEQMQIWVHRMAALEQGMKFYRFHGTRL
jgi:2-polyprenyl-3-methyl-5-hydroxy-6-metoxy-1,4-benzoquinol methylase